MGKNCSKPNHPLTIIHFNDAYEIKDRDGEICGGAARFCSLIESYKHLNPVVLFSGDLWNPSKCNLLNNPKVSAIFKGEQLVVPINKMNITAAGLGNHDLV